MSRWHRGEACRDCAEKFTDTMKHMARGLCSPCYDRNKRAGTLDNFPTNPIAKNAGPCSVVDDLGMRCVNAAKVWHEGLQICTTHFRRVQLGTPHLTEPLRKWTDTRVRDAEGRKLCRGCKRWLDVSRFAKHPQSGDRLNGLCKRFDSDAGHRLSWERKIKILESQGYACPCGDPLDEDNYSIDHDHGCCPRHTTQRMCGNCIRGLLCPNCNSALGLAKDDPEVLLRLASYLRREAA